MDSAVLEDEERILEDSDNEHTLELELDDTISGIVVPDPDDMIKPKVKTHADGMTEDKRSVEKKRNSIIRSKKKVLTKRPKQKIIGGLQDEMKPGMRYGMLTLLERIGKNKRKRDIWLCQCDCGNLHKVESYNLIRGKSKSCGCNITNSRSKQGNWDAYSVGPYTEDPEPWMELAVAIVHKAIQEYTGARIHGDNVIAGHLRRDLLSRYTRTIMPDTDMEKVLDLVDEAIRNGTSVSRSMEYERSISGKHNQSMLNDIK